MPHPLPTIGACLHPTEIADHKDWLFNAERDVELQGFHDAEVLKGDWRPLVDLAKKELLGMPGRLGIHGPFWGFTLDSHDPDIRMVVQQRLWAGLDVCEALGGTHMVVHSPYTTWDYNNLDNGYRQREKLVERVHETMLPAVRRAEDLGVVLVIENIEDVDPHARVGLAKSFDSDAVKVSIDTGHAAYAHGSTGAPPVDYYVHSAGNELQHVHLQDADGYADRHWGLGEGVVPWPAVFEALGYLDSEPRLVLELRDKSKIPASFAHLQELGLAR